MYAFEALLSGDFVLSEAPQWDTLNADQHAIKPKRAGHSPHHKGADSVGQPLFAVFQALLCGLNDIR